MGIACLEVTEGRVVLINADRALSCHRWVSLRTDAGAFTFTSATPEISYTVEAESGPPRSVTSHLHVLQIGHSPNASCCILAHDSQQLLCWAYTADVEPRPMRSVRLWVGGK